MAKFKHLQMAETICNDARISVSKSFLGLSTKVTYLPTNSSVYVKTIEFSPETGDKLKAILEGPREKLAKALKNLKPRPTVNGNYMVEACISRDGAFAALQLTRFLSLCYEPVTEVLIFERDEAQAIKEAL